MREIVLARLFRVSHDVVRRRHLGLAELFERERDCTVRLAVRAISADATSPPDSHS